MADFAVVLLTNGLYGPPLSETQLLKVALGEQLAIPDSISVPMKFTVT